jgi:hypothetical protein
VIVSVAQGMEVGQKDHLQTLLLVLSHVAATQPDLTELPSSAIKVGNEVLNSQLSMCVPVYA